MAFSFARKYNKSRLFDINTEGFEYVALPDMYQFALKECDGDVESAEDYPFVVRGIYINTKGLYDPAPVVAIEDCYVNLPAHLTEICKSILADPAAIRAINDGKVGFTIYRYKQNRFNKECYSVRWVDMD